MLAWGEWDLVVLDVMVLYICREMQNYQRKQMKLKVMSIHQILLGFYFLKSNRFPTLNYFHKYKKSE